MPKASKGKKESSSSSQDNTSSSSNEDNTFSSSSSDTSKKSYKKLVMKNRAKINSEPEIDTEKKNPFYQLPSLTMALYSMDIESIFSPVVIDSSSIVFISNIETLKDIEEFKNNICIGDEELAWKALERIYLDKYSVFKALLEVSMECIGQSSMPLVNTVFTYVYKIMNVNKKQVRADKIVAIVALIMAESKSNGYDTFLNSEIKRDPDGDVVKVLNSKLMLKDNILKNKKATIEEFDILYICSPRYWAYPNYLTQLIKQKKHKKEWDKEVYLPTEFTNRQERAIRELNIEETKTVGTY